MAGGGTSREPIFGVGASGRTYSFGENYQPERVTPNWQPAAGGGGGTTIVPSPARSAASTSSKLADRRDRRPQARGHGLMAATYKLLIDWNGNGNFADSADDVTARVLDQRTAVTVRYGRDQARQLSPTSPGELNFELNNISRDYSPENASSPLAGFVAPARRAAAGTVGRRRNGPLHRLPRRLHIQPGSTTAASRRPASTPSAGCAACP
jgi:hypothetical protein